MKGFVGIRSIADGPGDEPRQSRTGGLVVADGHGHFWEVVSRGNAYGVLNTAVRALTVSLTTTASLAIWNPTGSGRNLAILTTAFRYGGGTWAAGYIVHCLFPASSIPGGTAVQPLNLASGIAGGIAKCFELATGMSTAIAIRFAASHGALVSDQTTGAFSSVNRELVDGAIIVPPGTAYGLVSVSGAGTSPTAMFEYAWEEVPV